jgi:hypothetical protein
MKRSFHFLSFLKNFLGLFYLPGNYQNCDVWLSLKQKQGSPFVACWAVEVMPT